MEDIITTLNDEQDKITKKDEISPWRKKLIIGAVIAMFIIIILVIILLAVRSSLNEKEESENKDNILGEIICRYIVEDSSKETMLLGNEYEKGGDIDIFIMKKKVDFTKEYKFDKPDEYEVQFKLYSKINMNYMFKDVSSLKSVIMISYKDTSITSMISTFENCESLNDLTINGFNTDELLSMNKFLYKSKIKIINLNSFSTKNVEDMSFMFSSMDEFKFDFSKLDTCNVKNMSHMFYNNKDILNLDLYNFNTINVEDMSYMFSSCESLTSLKISDFNTKKVINMKGMFQNCITLEFLDLSNFNTELVTDMSNMFENCYGLRTLNLMNFDTSNVKNMSNMFY